MDHIKRKHILILKMLFFLHYPFSIFSRLCKKGLWRFGRHDYLPLKNSTGLRIWSRWCCCFYNKKNHLKHTFLFIPRSITRATFCCYCWVFNFPLSPRWVLKTVIACCSQCCNTFCASISHLTVDARWMPARAAQ